MINGSIYSEFLLTCFLMKTINMKNRFNKKLLLIVINVFLITTYLFIDYALSFRIKIQNQTIDVISNIKVKIENKEYFINELKPGKTETIVHDVESDTDIMFFINNVSINGKGYGYYTNLSTGTVTFIIKNNLEIEYLDNSKLGLRVW